jgi:hypothetical protein
MHFQGPGIVIVQPAEGWPWSYAAQAQNSGGGSIGGGLTNLLGN